MGCCQAVLFSKPEFCTILGHREGVGLVVTVGVGVRVNVGVFAPTVEVGVGVGILTTPLDGMPHRMLVGSDGDAALAPKKVNVVSAPGPPIALKRIVASVNVPVTVVVVRTSA